MKYNKKYMILFLLFWAYFIIIIVYLLIYFLYLKASWKFAEIPYWAPAPWLKTTDLPVWMQVSQLAVQLFNNWEVCKFKCKFSYQKLVSVRLSSRLWVLPQCVNAITVAFVYLYTSALQCLTVQVIAVYMMLCFLSSFFDKKASGQNIMVNVISSSHTESEKWMDYVHANKNLWCILICYSFNSQHMPS